MLKDGNGFLVRMDSGDLIFEDINLILANTIKLKVEIDHLNDRLDKIEEDIREMKYKMFCMPLY